MPAGSLGIEAFIHDGRHYLYFPPGPALLRMPLFLFTSRFDGRLTAVSMLLAYVLTIVLVALLIWRVRRILRGSAPLGRTEALGYGTLLVAATAGSTVLFLGSVPWVYHEAYAWAIPMAIGSGFCLLGVVERPGTGRIVATGLFTLGAVLSRTTAGWAVAGAVLLTAVFAPRHRAVERDRHLWWQIYLAGLVPIGAGMAVNWAKFRHPYLFPIEEQVFTQVNQHRRDAIAANGGDLFNPNLVWSTAVNYFRPTGIRFIRLFPFITLPPEIARAYGGGYLDQSNRTGSVVDFMPLMVGLSVWGLITTYWPGGPKRAAALRIPLLGVLAIPGGIMFYAYIAHRYTSEFVPFLVFGASVGLVDLARRLRHRPARTQRLAVAGIALLTAFSVLATLAAARTTQALADQGADLARYVARQDQVSGWTGDPIEGWVTRSDLLTLEGRADELRVIGDCQALYVGTGDEFRPWAEVGTRPLDVEVTVLGGEGLGPTGELVLAELTGHHRVLLRLERSGTSRYRVTLRGGPGDAASRWFRARPGESFPVRVDTGGTLEFHVVAGPFEEVLDVPRESHDDDWRFLPFVLHPTLPTADAAAAQGLRVEERATPPLEVCRDLTD